MLEFKMCKYAKKHPYTNLSKNHTISGQKSQSGVIGAVEIFGIKKRPIKGDFIGRWSIAKAIF
jgi:hypothetical protein